MSVVTRTVLPVVSAFVIFSFLAVTPADADLWGHLTFGRDIVHSGSLPARDAYSFTSDQPWINHEWLAEVTMWGAYRFGGAPGLVALKLLLACLVALALVETWRPLGLRNSWRDALLCLVAMSVWPQLQFVRPQLFSLVLFAWLLVVFSRCEAQGATCDGRGARGEVWPLLAIPPMFALWVNLHGGWIVGAAALLVFTACALFDRLVSNRRKLALVATSAAALLATLCNPYGTGMLAFLADTVRPNRADIIEWRPLPGLGAFVIGLWMLPAALAVFILLRRRRVPLPSLVIPFVFAIASLRVARLIGFFALAVALLLVPRIREADAAQIPPKPDPTSAAMWNGSAFLVRRSFSAGGRRISRGRLLRPMAVCLLAASLALPLFGRRIRVDAPWLPEPQAADFVATHGLRGNMFTFFDYGEYAIWHLAPAIRVSMDGRRETIYSQRMRDLHARIYANEPTAMADLASLGADHAWLPRTCPVIPTLEAHGWRRVFDGPRSVILTRFASSTPLVRTTAAVLPRSFPGP